MTTRPPRCLRCNSSMEAGFIADRSHYDASRQATWASGTPDPSFWRQSDVAKGARRLPVTTWRCTRCGWLESYAN